MTLHEALDRSKAKEQAPDGRGCPAQHAQLTSRPSMALMVALLPEPAMPSTSTVMENGSRPAGSAASAACAKRALHVSVALSRPTPSALQDPASVHTDAVPVLMAGYSVSWLWRVCERPYVVTRYQASTNKQGFVSCSSDGKARQCQQHEQRIPKTETHLRRLLRDLAWVLPPAPALSVQF